MKTWRFLVLAGLLLPMAAAIDCGEFEPDPPHGLPSAAASTSVDGMDASAIGPDPIAADDAAAPPGPFSDIGPVGPPVTGLHVAGNHIVDAQENPVTLHGVNRSGTEYRCVGPGGGIFDGPADEGSIQAIVSWKANAVRIPLNETCWLGTNGVAPASSGAYYQRAILGYVALLHRYNIVPIVELHWVGPNNLPATAQQPMPDEGAVAFWQSVTAAFSADDGVIFEPYNEPFPGMNRDTLDAWTCWRDGCPGVPQAGTPRDAGAMVYTAVGMQALVDAIRGAEGPVRHVILLGGIEYSNDLSMWMQYAAVDEAHDLGAAWHIYSNNACATAACWAGAPAQVAQSFPIVATEIGERDCSNVFVGPLMDWLDPAGISYLAWSWDAYGACAPQPVPDGGPRGSPWSLVTDYVHGVPNSPYAQVFHDHIAGL